MSTSFSKTDTYGSCPKLFEYKYIRNLQAKRQNTNLWKGTNAHEIAKDWFLLQRDGEVTYSNVFIETFISNWVAEYLDNFDASTMFEDELLDVEKEVNAIGRVVQGFLERKEFEGWTILHVEEEFVIEIDGHKVTCTPDLVAMDPEGFVWIIDHKTTEKHLDRDALDIRPQALFYYVAVTQFYDNVAGFIFNYLRKKVPVQPRMNKTRTKGVYLINRLKDVDTTYELLLALAEQESLMDNEDVRRRLGELRDHNTFYFMHRERITDDMAAATVGDLIARLILIDKSIADSLFPRTIQRLNGCRSCEFNSLCTTELTGGNTEVVLQWYEPREDHNPYEREEDAE